MLYCHSCNCPNEAIGFTENDSPICQECSVYYNGKILLLDDVNMDYMIQNPLRTLTHAKRHLAANNPDKHDEKAISILISILSWLKSIIHAEVDLMMVLNHKS